MSYSPIRQLSAEVIGQIAAGEVVERPAAAIKELVENSMDAGATAITVEIRDGGLTSFRVVDNGSGIRPNDIRMAFARHATSKISSASDLYGIRTLGFRGEALASIAAVSRITCTTRVKDAETGITVQVTGGEIGEIKEAACPEGTSFLVKDIFFNAPVRRRFMKKPNVEASYISELMMRFILSHPQISFRFTLDGKLVYFSAGDGKLESAIVSVYGLSLLESLYPVKGNMNGLVLDGFVGIGDQSRGNRAQQSFILNERLIKSPLLSSALEEACRQRVMIGRFPICILHLTLPYESVDVNVHPNKWEVRFENEPAIREAMERIIYDSIQVKNPLESAEPLFQDTAAEIRQVYSVQSYTAQRFLNKTAEYKEEPPVDRPDNQKPIDKEPVSLDKNPSSIVNIPDSTYNKGLQPSSAGLGSHTPALSSSVSESPLQEQLQSDVPYVHEKVSQPVPNPVSQQSVTISEQYDSKPDTFLPESFNELPVRLIGIVFNTYIILECDGRMLLCDQHAVHERLLFEQMKKSYGDTGIAQQLLAPVNIQLSYREYAIYQDSKDALLAAGFEVSDFGDRMVQLRSVPMVLGQAKSVDCFHDALDDLAECGKISTQKRTDRIIQMACKHAVKGGERAPMEAIFGLIRQMIRDNVTPTCPHGRPLVVEVTQRDLEKRFHRIQ